MTLTLIAVVWNKPLVTVERWAASLSTHAIDHVVLVDMSQTNANLDNGIICRRYGYQHFYCPTETPNMAKAFNFGIRYGWRQTEYVMMTGVDWLFSPNFFTVLKSKLGSRNFISALSGYLPPDCNLDLSWPELVKIAEQGEISRRLSPGACQCVPWVWAREVQGYDERFPAQDGVDDDFRCRAIKAGLDNIWIEWSEAQALHMWHPRSETKGLGSELFNPDAPVIANEHGWGEYWT